MIIEPVSRKCIEMAGKSTKKPVKRSLNRPLNIIKNYKLKIYYSF
ncbi:hypothetical protein SAMN05444266_104290 [Chitinophaga jiangningensis]|uniref:Uncharacterized protein n=1 Tax=Chitinophaga jiangningensis TaxID=1419482 RepID=A0A1M7CDZ0_9BACT|nr:hypothetical protein SAMN05444266_104290 [Chitinophaga jiangningensis]